MSDLGFSSNSPLAEQMRPQLLADVVGQDHLLIKGKLLREIVDKNQPTSLILWGPPGTGKTTIARILGNSWNADFKEISAVTSGLADVRDVVKYAQQNKRLGQRTLLFVDEIHRFNKAQQDAFLPHVENGTIILVGATTENPSFEVIGALLSRTRVVVLNALDEDAIKILIKKAAKFLKVKITPKATNMLASQAAGDGRIALGALESAAKLAGKESIKPDHVSQAMQHTAPAYDKKGSGHYNVISAFIKSMRASDKEAALYYLFRMLQAGEDPKFIARRIVIFASEDIGMASPHAITMAVAAFQAVERIGLPEGEFALAHATTAMCEAAKSRGVTDDMFAAKERAKNHPNSEVPLHLRNAPTKLMKDLGYNKGYKWKSGFNHEKSNLPQDVE